MKNLLFFLLLSTSTISHGMRLDNEGTSSSTQSVCPRVVNLKGLTFNQLTDRINQARTPDDLLNVSPQTILSAAISDLEGKPNRAQINESFLKGMFALFLFDHFTGELMDSPLGYGLVHRATFFSALRKVTTGQKEKDFASLKPNLPSKKKLNLQSLRAMAQRDMWQNSFVEEIFGNTVERLLARYNSVIILSFKLPPQIKFPLVSKELYSRNDAFLDFALCFGVQSAINWLVCESQKQEVQGNRAQEKTYLEKGARLGIPLFMHNFHAFLMGEGKIEEHEAWLQKAAESEFPLAMEEYGGLLQERGHLQEAKLWFQKAANRGQPESMFQLGILSLNGRDILGAKKYFQKAGEAGLAKSWHNLGCLHQKEGNFKGAITAWTNSANTGIVESMDCLRSLYNDRKNHKEAKIWAQKAADSGHISSAFFLGSCLTEENDIEGAKKYYQIAASKGNSHAMFNLAGVLYDQGNLHEAKIWYQNALANGINRAYFWLSRIYCKEGNRPEAIRNINAFIQALGTTAELQNSKTFYRLAITLDVLGDFAGAESYYKTAISYNSQDALIAYTRLLYEQGRVEFDTYKSLCLEEETDETTEDTHLDSSSDSRESSTEPASASSKIETETREEILIPQTEKVEAYTPPPLSKRMQRLFDREEKQRKRQMKASEFFTKESERSPTYKDVSVVAVPGLETDIRKHELRIQMLISALANGERRGHFEPLSNMDGLFSMRISEGDRLVFKITEGGMEKGVRGIKILSAKGHYNDINFKKTTIPVVWSEDEASSSADAAD